MAALPAGAEIAAARFVEPTTRYGHDVLGGGGEWAGMELTRKDGQIIRITLPERLVFEDLEPRLVDVDGDGTLEVIAVQSDASLGARLTIWGSDGMIAATPPIGQRNRWLAPIGAADLDGDGHVEIAVIDRPHLARILRIWRYRDGELEPAAEQSGLTNHRIGEAFISSGIRDCGTGAELVMAQADWSRLVVARLVDERIQTQDIGRFAGPESLQNALACEALQ